MSRLKDYEQLREENATLREQLAEAQARIEELEIETKAKSEYLQQAHKAVSKMAGYSPLLLNERIEKQLQKR